MSSTAQEARDTLKAMVPGHLAEHVDEMTTPLCIALFNRHMYQVEALKKERESINAIYEHRVQELARKIYIQLLASDWGSAPQVHSIKACFKAAQLFYDNLPPYTDEQRNNPPE